MSNGLTNSLQGSLFANEWSVWCDMEKDVRQPINIISVITWSLLQYEPHGIHLLLRGHVNVMLLCDDRWLWYLIDHIACWCSHPDGHDERHAFAPRTPWFLTTTTTFTVCLPNRNVEDTIGKYGGAPVRVQERHHAGRTPAS